MNNNINVEVKQESMSDKATSSTQTEMIDVSETAIVEYLDIVKSEYENERNKKQSFENRAGLIMALLGAICIFLFEKVKLSDVFSLMNTPITFITLIKIISGLLVYTSFVFTIVMIIKTIIVQKHDNFEVRSIDEILLREQRVGALCRIIFTYRDIIVQHRDLNEKRASVYRKSLYGVSLTLVSIIIYISILS